MARLRQALEAHPELRARIVRGLMIRLHEGRHVTIEEICARRSHEALDETGGADPASSSEGLTSRWSGSRRRQIERITLEEAERWLPESRIVEVLDEVLGGDPGETLASLARRSNTPFEAIARKMEECLAGEEREARRDLSGAGGPSREIGTRVALIRQVLSESLDYIAIAKECLGIEDLAPIARRTIGPPGGRGRIGGKAAGLVLAHKILTTPGIGPDGQRDPPFEILVPESYFLRTDLFLDFFEANGLIEYADHKYRTLDEITHAYAMLREVVKNAVFPTYAVEGLSALLARVGQEPLIVRSSSLLEDSFGSAFAGKYASFFVPNQGPFEARLERLQGAIAEVYASVLSPDAILYRQKRRLLDYDEQMGVLIQKVVGFRFGSSFLPAFAGVAFSRNEHRWSRRIRKEDGVIRIVMGLGTRAVERVAEDFPRMVNLTIPSLRAEADVESMVRYSQRHVDFLDLERDRFQTLLVREFLAGRPGFPRLDWIASVHESGSLLMPATALVDADATSLVVTFDKLVQRTDFFADMRRMLRRLEVVYGCPVDVEFAHDGERLYLLQCRPLSRSLEGERRPLPESVPKADIVFSARRDVPTGTVRGIEYVVFVDPEAYSALGSVGERMEVGRIVGKLNQVLAKRTFILLGPGRWGCVDINLGVRVGYADLCHTRVLIEISWPMGRKVPELSYGTHFFQDLLETGIHYLPLYPDDSEVVYNEEFLRGSPSALASLIPVAGTASGAVESCVRVVHVPAVTGGRWLDLVMDPETDRAMAYLVGGKEG